MEEFSKTYSTNSFTKPKLQRSCLTDISFNQPQFQRSYPLSFKIGHQTIASKPDQCHKLFSKIGALQLQLKKAKQLNSQSLNNPIFAVVQHTSTSSYQQLSNCNRQLQKNDKLKINQKFTNLQQQLQQAYKRKIKLQKKYQKQIKQSVEQLNYKKNKIFEQCQKASKNSHQSILQNGNKIKEQVKQFCKENEKFRSQVFGMLSSVRSKLTAQIDQQQTKRKYYDQILHQLLEKSCQKAQHLVRRKL